MSARRERPMALNQAVIEGERWLANLATQEQNSIRLQQLASARRAGTMDEQTVRRELALVMDRSPTIFDGAELARAVRTLIDFVKQGETPT